MDKNENFFVTGIDSYMLVPILRNLDEVTRKANIEIQFELIEQPCIHSIVDHINALLEKKVNSYRMRRADRLCSAR